VVRACSECGRELPKCALDGLCPACLLRLGAAELSSEVQSGPEPGRPGKHTGLQPTEEPHRPSISHPSGIKAIIQGLGMGVRLGDYELLELVGQGGMGVVYKARQISLNRIVALKLLPFGQFTHEDAVSRFRAEASAAAGLQHCNIVAIHEVGEHEGQHYFSMDFVEGQTLADIVRDKPLSAQKAATYLKSIAEAVHFAHKHGILHRDLKPSNILIDDSDQPHITDFGLAKRLTVDSDMTLTGQVLGSPNFMAPEQAEGRHKDVGPASDIYSLGGLLYHLVTRQPPFQSETLTTLLKQVIETEPVPPRILNPSVPRDLETICLKCLEKEIARRYPTAEALAEDLCRFLKGEPIHARPVGAAGKAWKWCQRRPVLAGLSATLTVSLLVGATGIIWQWQRARASELFARQSGYAADLNLAQRTLADNDIGYAASLLDKYRPSAGNLSGQSGSQIDIRNWEWRYLWRLCRGREPSILYQYSNNIGAMAASGDAKLLAIQIGGRKGVVWDLVTRKPKVKLPGDVFGDVALSASGDLVAFATQNEQAEPCVDLWNLAAGRLASTVIRQVPVSSLALSPDGKLLATLDKEGNVALVECTSGISLTNIHATLGRGFGVLAFSPDGNRLAIGEDYGVIRILNWRSGVVLPIQTPTFDGVTVVAFSPKGELVAAGFGFTSRTIKLWDASSGESRGQLTNHTDWVRALAFSPDGQRLASGSVDQTIRVWSVTNQTELCCLRGHQSGVVALAFLPDGRTLLSGGDDGSIRLWDLPSSNGTDDPPGLASASGTIPGKVDLSSYSPENVNPYALLRLGTAFTADGRCVIRIDQQGGLGVWDVSSARLKEALTAMGSNLWSVALSPDDRWLAVGSGSGMINIWDWHLRRMIGQCAIPCDWCGVIRFSPSRRFLHASVLLKSGRLVYKIWRTNDWQEVSLPEHLRAGLRSAALSPDDRLIAVGYEDGDIRLSEFPDCGHEVAVAKCKASVYDMHFSPDGKRLISAGADGRVALWDVVRWRESATWRGHPGPIWCATVSPDGTRLATAGSGPKDAVKLWDITTQRELLTLTADGQFFLHVSFSPDGRTLAATSFAGLAYVWRAPSWAEIQAVENLYSGGHD
jgi:eukaryotic-like serine/threonine-protein kinase